MLALGLVLCVWLCVGLWLFQSYGGNGRGKKTQAAGTTIEVLVPPHVSGVTHITKIVYTAAGTAHTITVMRPVGRTTASAAASTGQAVVAFTADPNTIAANDWVAIRHSTDGVTRQYKVSSVAGLNVTMTANLGATVAAGDKIWVFGVAGDTNPTDGEAHPGLTGTASVTTSYSDSDSGVVSSYAKDDPLLVQSNNATAAGTIEQVSYSYTKF